MHGVEGVVSVSRLVRPDAGTGESRVAVPKVVFAEGVAEILHDRSSARICTKKIQRLNWTAVLTRNVSDHTLNELELERVTNTLHALIN